LFNTCCVLAGAKGSFEASSADPKSVLGRCVVSAAAISIDVAAAVGTIMLFFVNPVLFFASTAFNLDLAVSFPALAGLSCSAQRFVPLRLG